MHIFLGTLALLGVGLIGLLLEIHKQDKRLIKVFQDLNDDQAGIISEQRVEIIRLQANQKPVPWNKGKKYKLPRGVNGKPLRKETTYVLSNAPIVAAWDKDGNQTVSPQWENLG